MLTLFPDQIAVDFRDLNLAQREILRGVLLHQHGKRKDNGGWVAAKDVGGSREDPIPMKLLVDLVERGFLRMNSGSFNGRRFKFCDGVNSLPTEEEIRK